MLKGEKNNARHKKILLGVDLILDQHRQWHIIEVNDHPVGLKLSDQLFNAGRDPWSERSSSGIEEIASELMSHSNNEDIILLLPDCYRIRGGVSNVSVKATDLNFLEDYRIGRNLDDFNALLKELKQNKAKAYISDVTAVEQKRDEVWVKKRPVAAMYRRSAQFPLSVTSCYCLNDLRLRKICRDKSHVGLLLKSVGLEKNCIPYYSLKTEDKVARLLLESGKSVIIKPKRGSGSKGVQKVSSIPVWEQACQDLTNSIHDEEVVFQEWIEPSSVNIEGRNFYYDIRVNILGNTIISALARCSAAPIDNPLWRDTPLVWLTTTGKLIPVVTNGINEDGLNAVFLSKPELEKLQEIVSAINIAISVECAGTSYEKAIETIGSFGAQEGFKEKMHYINLLKNKAHV
ncbi:MAG: hypothetical protein JWO09_3598 [Bacteroidetes bacterium]|nr:hypothetical protein [Bacteroidota bacterium]